MRTRSSLEKRFGDSVEVTWHEFVAGPQLLEGLNVGSIDFGYTGEVPPIFAQAAGAPMYYVAWERIGPLTSAILVGRDSPIKSVADLRGKRLALHKASSVHYFVVRALEASGLKYSDVDSIYLPPADARVAFESGRVDAWAIWDPYYAAVVEAGTARPLADGEGLIENRAFYLGRREFVDDNPDIVAQVVAAMQETSDWAAAHRDEVAVFMADAIGMDPRVLKVAEARRNYGVFYMNPDVTAYQQRMADTFLDLGLIPQRLAVADAVWQPPAK